MINLQKYGSLIGAVGNTLEWYNFALFMPFLHVLSKEFFPFEDVFYSEILSFLIVSVGLFMRPFGAMIFGPVGDKFGRQKAISASVVLMVISTLCIGLLPNYRQIGIYAPILLIFFRGLQGISLGGEYTAAMVNLVECAPGNKRGFYGSWSDAGIQVGVLLGGQSLVLLCNFFPNNEIYDFAWRIPFLFSVILLPFSFLIPSNVKPKINRSKDIIFKMLRTYKKEVCYTIAVTAFSAIGFYTLLTFLPYHLTKSNVLTLKESTICTVCATLITTISILIAGYLSDRFSKKFFMISGIIGVTFVICFMFMTADNSFNRWLILQLIYGLFIGMYYSSRAAFFSEAFPEEVRCTAISLSFSFSQAVFGGLTPVIINYFTKISMLISVVPVILVAIFAIYALIRLKPHKQIIKN